MTPKEKAKILFEKLYEEGLSDRQAKECAILVVREVIEAISNFGYANTMYDDPETNKITFIDDKLPEIFWHEVIYEIDKL